MIEPIGSEWWWHLSEHEQDRYISLLRERYELARLRQRLSRGIRNMQEMAMMRCKREPEHFHSMRGLIR